MMCPNYNECDAPSDNLKLLDFDAMPDDETDPDVAPTFDDYLIELQEDDQ